MLLRHGDQGRRVFFDLLGAEKIVVKTAQGSDLSGFSPFFVHDNTSVFVIQRYIIQIFQNIILRHALQHRDRNLR